MEVGRQLEVVPTISSHLTTTEWTGKISAWPDSTSTSPPDFHLTHSKALIAKHNLTPGSLEYAALKEQ